MSEYIERGAVLEVMDTIIGRLGGSKAEELLFTAARLRIKSLPTVDPVHAAGGCYCRECRYYQGNNGGYPNPDCRWGHDETPDPDDFCSYGEKEENDG